MQLFVFALSVCFLALISTNFHKGHSSLNAVTENSKSHAKLTIFTIQVKLFTRSTEVSKFQNGKLIQDAKLYGKNVEAFVSARRK
jgi:hypothetical protein